MDDLRFTIPEILSLIGVTQCVYILVYITLRAGRISRAGLPILYFLILGLAFLSDFAARHLGDHIPGYDIIRWFAWFYGPPLSVLLAVQVARITRVPELRHFWVVLLTPLAFAVSWIFSGHGAVLDEWLVVCGLVAGAVSLLALWVQNRGVMDSLPGEKSGKERYWLILALVIANILFLGTMLASLSPYMEPADAIVMRNILGLGFVYLVSTSLFRIYPRAVNLAAGAWQGTGLTAEETALAGRIEALLDHEKVYQESAYSRADLARECGASEAVISRVINAYFKKSFPQLMNERRIADAKDLLRQTDAAVNIICAEVGFNSLPSFNRVFKDMTGLSPSEYRKSVRK